MTRHAGDGPRTPTPDTTRESTEKVQMNVRVPRNLRDAIDRRRVETKLSRDVTVERMLRWALKNPPPKDRSKP